MDVVFPYEKAGSNIFGAIYRPMAKVSFQSPKKTDVWADTWMIVDTGADFTILPQFAAADLQISLEHDCVKDATVGVGGERSIFLCKNRITAKVGSISRKVPLAFFDNNEVPPLLGRLGFLETFDTTFLKKHVVVFKG